MSKIVKIPETMNPFEVHVNHKKYLYPAGTEQEVPDEVAEIIERHHEAMQPKSEPAVPPFGGNGEAGGSLSCFDIEATVFSTGIFSLNKEQMQRAFDNNMAIRAEYFSVASGNQTFYNAVFPHIKECITTLTVSPGASSRNMYAVTASSNPHIECGLNSFDGIVTIEGAKLYIGTSGMTLVKVYAAPF